MSRPRRGQSRARLNFHREIVWHRWRAFSDSTLPSHCVLCLPTVTALPPPPLSSRRERSVGRPLSDPSPRSQIDIGGVVSLRPRRFSPTHALTHALTHARTHSRTHALAHALTHALTHSATHSPRDKRGTLRLHTPSHAFMRSTPSASCVHAFSFSRVQRPGSCVQASSFMPSEKRISRALPSLTCHTPAPFTLTLKPNALSSSFMQSSVICSW